MRDCECVCLVHDVTFLWPLRCQLSARLWGPREDKRELERVHGKGRSTLTSRSVRGCQIIMNKGGDIKKERKRGVRMPSAWRDTKGCDKP